jgi:hypothetical protein
LLIIVALNQFIKQLSFNQVIYAKITKLASSLMFKTKARYGYIFFLLFLFCQLTAQYDISNFKKYTQKNGLSNNFIRIIQQDNRGFIWLGTEYGLNRFDGRNFVSFFPEKAKKNSAAALIFKMTYIGNDEMAIATESGAFIFNTSTHQFHELKFEVENGMEYWAYKIKDVNKDKFGNYGVSSGTGFYIFDKHYKLKIRYDHYTLSSPETKAGYLSYGKQIYVLSDGVLRQKTQNGICIYDHKLNKITALRSEQSINCKSFNLNSNNVCISHIYANQSLDLFSAENEKLSTLKISKPTNLNIDWISYVREYNDTTWFLNGWYGLYKIKYNATNNEISIDENLQLKETSIFTHFFDKSGKLWLGTKIGLYKEIIHTEGSKLFDFSSSNNNFVGQSILSLGPIIAVLSADNRVAIYSKKLNEIIKIFTFESLRKKQVGSIFELSNHEIFFDTYGEDFIIDVNKLSIEKIDISPYRYRFDKINNIIKGNNETLFLATNRINGIFKWHPNMNYKNDPKLIKNSFEDLNGASFSKDKKGQIYVNSDINVVISNGSDTVSQQLKKPSFYPKEVRVYGIFFDNKGNPWYQSPGLPWTTIRNGKPITLNQTDLIPRISYDYTKFEGDYVFYLNVFQNLVRLNINDFSYNIIGSEVSQSAESPIAHFDIDTTLKEVYFISDNNLYTQSYKTVKININREISLLELSILGSPAIIYPPQNIGLNCDQNNFSIKFACLEYDNNDALNYSYRMQPSVDSNWIKLDNPEIYFSNLNSGKYQLELKIASIYNSWPSVVKKVNVYISPPFYNTWWFIFSIVLTGTLLIWWIFKNRVRAIENDKKLLESEIKALHAQMNPHFLFNALNSIKELIIFRENEAASRYISKFSTLVRTTLDHSKKSTISLAENIIYLKKYLDMEVLRFPNLRYEVSCNDELVNEDINIPPMILQPLLENALIHGFSGFTENLYLSIKIYKAQGKIIIDVIDNGRGLQKEIDESIHSNSIAINNIKTRMQMLNERNKTDFCLEIIDRKTINPAESGVISRLSFNN